MRGKTFSLTPADCERDLYIRAKDACGTAESFFVIPCQVTNYYYDVNVALGEVAIGVVKTDNAEVNAILTAQKAKQAVVFNAATDVKIKSVVVYTENRQVLYSKEYAMGVSEIKIDAVSWASGVYHLSISNGTEVRHQKIMIPKKHTNTIKKVSRNSHKSKGVVSNKLLGSLGGHMGPPLP